MRTQNKKPVQYALEPGGTGEGMQNIMPRK